MNKLSVVVTIYKNEDNIRPFYENFNNEIVPFIDDYEIIMVNDASPDNSWAIMEELASHDPKVKIIKLMRNFGAVAASFIGIKYSTGDCVTLKAADLQEPESLLIEMYKRWKNGAKSVLAVREDRNDPLHTVLFSSTYYWLVQKMISKKMPKGGFDTYLIDQSFARLLVEQNDNNSPITLQLLWMGCGDEKVYYKRQKRLIGKSSWTFSKKLKLFADSFIGFSYIPIRFMTAIGLTSAILSFIYAIYMVVVHIFGKVDVKGFTTLVVLLAFFCGLILFSLGILGEYVWRALDSSRNRPIAIVEATKNFEN